MFSYHPLKMMPSLLGCGGLPEAIGKRMHDMAVVALAETLRNEDAYAKLIRFLGKFHSTQPPKTFPEFHKNPFFFLSKNINVENR